MLMAIAARHPSDAPQVAASTCPSGTCIGQMRNDNFCSSFSTLVVLTTARKFHSRYVCVFGRHSAVRNTCFVLRNRKLIPKKGAFLGPAPQSLD